MVNKSKCVFGAANLEYLGHMVTPQGILPLPSRVKTVMELPNPDSRPALQRFLGLINYYHRFLPGIAPKLAPLHWTLAGKGKDITWTPQCAKAFEEAKTAPAEATLLHHPQPNAATSITVDASDVAIGAS